MKKKCWRQINWCRYIVRINENNRAHPVIEFRRIKEYDCEIVRVPRTSVAHQNFGFSDGPLPRHPLCRFTALYRSSGRARCTLSSAVFGPENRTRTHDSGNAARLNGTEPTQAVLKCVLSRPRSGLASVLSEQNFDSADGEPTETTGTRRESRTEARPCRVVELSRTVCPPFRKPKSNFRTPVSRHGTPSATKLPSGEWTKKINEKFCFSCTRYNFHVNWKYHKY